MQDHNKKDGGGSGDEGSEHTDDGLSSASSYSQGDGDATIEDPEDETTGFSNMHNMDPTEIGTPVSHIR